MITTLIVTLVLTAVVWLTHSLRSMDLVINRGVSIGNIMGLVLLLLPDVLSVLLPISLFISVLVVLNRLQQDHEIVVMGAVGLSPWQIAKPFIKVALACSFVLCLITFLLLPLSFKQFRALQTSYQNHYKASLIQAGEFLNFNKVTVFVKERDMAGNVGGVFIYDGRDQERPVTFTAGSGHLVESEAGPKLILFDGTRQALDGQNQGVSFLTFSQYVHELKRPPEGESKREKKPSECYIWELFGDHPQLSPDGQHKMRVEGNNRLLVPLLPVVFALIALSILLLIPYNRLMPSLPFVWATLSVLAVEVGMVTFLNYASQWQGFMYLAYGVVFLPLLGSLFLLRRDPYGTRQVRA